MFGNATALGGLHMTGKYRDKNMLHTRSRHAAWDPHREVGHGNDENWSVWKVLIRGRSWERTAVSHQVMRPPNSLFLSSLRRWGGYELSFRGLVTCRKLALEGLVT